MKNMEKYKNKINFYKAKLKESYKKDPRIWLVSLGVILLLSIWTLSKLSESQTRVLTIKEKIDFSGGRVLSPSRDIYQRTEKILANRLKRVELNQKKFAETLRRLNETLENIEQKKIEIEKPDPDKTKTEEPEQKPSTTETDPTPRVNGISMVRPSGIPQSAIERSYQQQYRKRSSSGPSVISFPVKQKENSKDNTVVIPSGSFMRAKLLTGVEAPEGKPLPVLLQADFAFVGPNKTRIDLSGCFLIAKSTGNLSIERVEMQASKISCVSKSGKMFERDINGFIADDKDNSFAVSGYVNTKQDRVASMAFLSSIVEGIGKAIQQAQTTNSVGSNGSLSSIVTGDQKKYLAAGGASNAATLVTQFYLERAKSLLPTINVGSGQDVWVVVQSKVDLPNWYFQKSKKKSGGFSYLSRVLD